MRCHSPITIRNPAYRTKANQKNHLQTVPCGKCSACLSNRRTEWSTRLEIELKHTKKALFVTLTYSDKFLPESNELVKKDCQDFIKRLRHAEVNKIKYYLVGEYGENTLRPHYHMIIFNISGNMDEATIKLLKAWQKGLIHVGDVNSKTIRYTTKYMIQNQELKNDKTNKQLPFALISKNLGRNYIANYTRWHREDSQRNYVVVEGGTKKRLPRYFREKIYNSAERKAQNDAQLKKQQEADKLKSADELKTEASQSIDKKEAYKRKITKTLKSKSKL